MPLIGSEEFQIASTTLVVSFIVSFGIVKAFSNLVSGQLADRWGRKRVLVLGWLVGLPFPFIIIAATDWTWIIAANVLLGISQGLAWSMTVIMKIDLVGPKSRGLAVGLNEFAGYLAVGLTALATGYLAAAYGLRPVPIYIGVFYAIAGLLLSVLVVRDTRSHVEAESGASPDGPRLSFREVFVLTSIKDRNLFAASQAGLVWRDLGYAVGALAAGIIADRFGFAWAIVTVGVLTFLSGVVVAITMQSRLTSR